MNTKTKFRLPNTKRCIVVWYRNGKPNQTTITTPVNCDMLQTEMLKHKVGYSEIRTVLMDPASALREVLSGDKNALNALATSMHRF